MKLPVLSGLYRLSNGAEMVVINMQEPWTECTVCGADTLEGWGLPIWNGLIVANDWPGEWGGVPACESCWERHERGELVEVPTSEYAAIFAQHGPASAPGAGGPGHDLEGGGA